MALLLAIVIAGVPLLITPGLMFYFDVTPKNSLLLLGVAAGLCITSRNGLPARTALNLLLAAQAVSVAIATALSTNPALSLNGTNWRRFGLVTEIALLLMAAMTASFAAQGRQRVVFLLRVVSLSGMAAALYGILQYFGWDPLLPASSYHVGEGIWTIVRPPGTLGRANYLASYLLFAAFAGVALASSDDRPWWRRCGGTAAALGSIAIILSGTRAAILGLLFGTVLLLAWVRPRFQLRWLVIPLLASIALAGFYYSSAGLQLRSRTRWYQDDPQGGVRLWLWTDSLRMARERWLFGFGPETFSAEYPRFESADTARAFPDMYHESPHNVYLDALVSRGVLGLLVLAGLTALGLAAAWRARTTHRVLSGALLAAFASGLLSLQFIVFTVPVALLFYVTLALLLALEPAVTTPAPRWIRFAAPALALLLAVAGLQLAIADFHLARARRLLEARDFSAALSAYEQVLNWQPRGTSSDLWWSRALLGTAQNAIDFTRLQIWQKSLEAARRAATLAEDRHNAWYNLAQFYARQNEAAQTERCLRQAIAYAPNWFKPHWVLSQLLMRSGRADEARREASLAVFLNGGKNPEVLQNPNVSQ